MNPAPATYSRTAGLSLVVHAAGIGLAFVAQVIVARLLGVVEFGLFAWCMAALNAAAVAARLGLDTAMLRFGAASLAAGETRRYAGLFRLARRHAFLASLVIAPLASLAIVMMRGGKDNPNIVAVALICGLWFPVLAVNGVRQSALLARGWIVRSSAPETILRPVVLVLTLGVVVMSRAPDASHAAAAAGVSVLAAYFLGQHWVRDLAAKPDDVAVDATAQSDFLRASRGLFLLAVTYAVLSQVDLIALGGLAAGGELGFYSAAKQIASVALLGLFAIQSGMSPALAAAYASGDRLRIESAVSFVAWAGVLFAVTTTLAILLGNALLFDMFGPGFQQGTVVLHILLIAQLFIAFNGPVGIVASMTGCHAAATRAYLAAAVIVIVGTVVFYGRIGALAPAWATLAGTVWWVTVLRLHLVRTLSIDTLPRVRSLRLWRSASR